MVCKDCGRFIQTDIAFHKLVMRNCTINWLNGDQMVADIQQKSQLTPEYEKFLLDIMESKADYKEFYAPKVPR